MSVQRITKQGRTRWEVRWREDGRHRSRLFDRRGDALSWEAEVRRRRQLGPLAVAALTTRAPTLGEWIKNRWAPEHAATLEQSTRERYANVYELHVAPHLDGVSLTDLTVSRLRGWQAGLLDCGVQPGTVLKARTLLSSVLRHAAEAEAIPGNPLPIVRAPKNPQRDIARPLAPQLVETIRASALRPVAREVAASGPGQRPRRAYQLPVRDPLHCRRDAIIISLLAYAGLRPGELRALRWGDIRERTLLIQRAAAPDGHTKATKTSQARTVRLLAPLAADLREWKLASGCRDDSAFVITGDKQSWTKIDWQIWRRDHWTPACVAAGVAAPPRPYDLRHSFASLLLAEGRQPLYVARQLGHSPTVLLRTYAHLLDELEEAARIDPEAEITSARATAGVRPAYVSTARGSAPAGRASGDAL